MSAPADVSLATLRERELVRSFQLESDPNLKASECTLCCGGIVALVCVRSQGRRKNIRRLGPDGGPRAAGINGGAAPAGRGREVLLRVGGQGGTGITNAGRQMTQKKEKDAVFARMSS